jgi:hypothetical protein
VFERTLVYTPSLMEDFGFEGIYAGMEAGSLAVTYEDDEGRIYEIGVYPMFVKEYVLPPPPEPTLNPDSVIVGAGQQQPDAAAPPPGARNIGSDEAVPAMAVIGDGGAADEADGIREEKNSPVRVILGVSIAAVGTMVLIVIFLTMFTSVSFVRPRRMRRRQRYRYKNRIKYR